MRGREGVREGRRVLTAIREVSCRREDARHACARAGWLQLRRHACIRRVASPCARAWGSSFCVASRANMLYLAARTLNRATVCLHAAHIAAKCGVRTDCSWLPTETPFLPQHVEPRRQCPRSQYARSVEKAECFVLACGHCTHHNIHCTQLQLIVARQRCCLI